MSDLTTQRRQKLQKIYDLGLDAYPQPNLSKRFQFTSQKKLGRKATVAGRLMLLRGHGKILLPILSIEKAKSNFFEANTLGEKMDLVKLLDLGDIISAQGEVLRPKLEKLLSELVILSS